MLLLDGRGRSRCSRTRRLRGRWLGLLLRLGLFAGRDDGVKDGAFHAGHEFDHTGLANVLNQTVDDGIAEFAVGHLTATEAQTRLDLVAIIEKADRLVLLGLVVMLVDGHRELDFLHDDDLLLLAGSAFALVFLVEEATVVLDAADRGDSVGRNLNQVESPLLGNTECLKRWENAELLTVFVDDADLARADSFVDTDKLTGRTLIECYGSPPGAYCPSDGHTPALPV